MANGPTQNYDGAEAVGWRPRPVFAGLVRATASFGPVLFALAGGAAAAHWVPAARTGLPGTVWLFLVVALSSVVLVLLSHLTRRLVPLAALLRLSLVLPDRVPSRFAVARRTWSPSRLRQAGRPDDDEPVDWLLALVGALSEHDARTRAHGERVQAYAGLIGTELGLSRDDVDRLSWAALLHDVGKVHVPVEVINKKGLPDDEEWATLQEHPAHGGRLVEPLRGWLGPWLDGVEQHHERFDGGGYPRGLTASEISLAARVIAVADTYDAITSARSYKKPLSAEAARTEITRCAGAQFDPEVVRAFLSVGVGRLRLIAGPATLLAALPGVGSLPAQAVSNISAVAQTAGGQVATAVLSAGLGVGVGVGASFAATGAVAAEPVPVVVAAQSADEATAGLPSSTETPAVPTTSPSDVAAVQALGAAAPVPSASASTSATTSASPSTSTGRTVLDSSATSTPSTPSARPSSTTPPSEPPSTTARPTGSPTAVPTQTPTTSPTTTATTTEPPAAPTPAVTSATSAPTTTTTSPAPTASPTGTSSCAEAQRGSTRLAGKDLSGCDLRSRVLTGAWDGVALHGADLTAATLLNLSLTSADLNGADLDLAQLIGVDLRGADLRGASFRGAVLTGVDVTGAVWNKHTFDGAVLVTVTGMTTN